MCGGKGRGDADETRCRVWRWAGCHEKGKQGLSEVEMIINKRKLQRPVIELMAAATPTTWKCVPTSAK